MPASRRAEEFSDTLLKILQFMLVLFSLEFAHPGMLVVHTTWSWSLPTHCCSWAGQSIAVIPPHTDPRCCAVWLGQAESIGAVGLVRGIARNRVMPRQNMPCGAEFCKAAPALLSFKRPCWPIHIEVRTELTTHTHTHTRSHTHTHTPTHTHAHTRAHTHTHPPTHPPTHARTHARTRMRTRTRTRTPTPTHRHKRTHSHTHAHAQAHTPSHTHTQTHTHARTHQIAYSVDTRLCNTRV